MYDIYVNREFLKNLFIQCMYDVWSTKYLSRLDQSISGAYINLKIKLLDPVTIFCIIVDKDLWSWHWHLTITLILSTRTSFFICIDLWNNDGELLFKFKDVKSDNEFSLHFIYAFYFRVWWLSLQEQKWSLVLSSWEYSQELLQQSVPLLSNMEQKKNQQGWPQNIRAFKSRRKKWSRL